jgi:proline racemase
MNLSALIHTIDLHTAGWPVRLVSSHNLVSGATNETLDMQASRLWNDDKSPLRWLQREPRGHMAMRIAVCQQSLSGDALLLMFDSQGPCRVDGLDVLCCASAIAEMGSSVVFWSPKQIDGEKPIAQKVVTPGGSYCANLTLNGTAVESVSIEAELAECVAAARPITVGDQAFMADWAVCGHRYVIINAADTGLSLSIEQLTSLERLAIKLVSAMKEQWCANGESLIQEPQFEHERNRIVMAEGLSDNAENVKLCVFDDAGKLLRAPESGAIGAVLSVMQRNGGTEGRKVIFQGLSGGVLEGRIKGGMLGESRSKLAWELRGRAFVTGSHQFIIDPSDPLPDGFLLR